MGKLVLRAGLVPLRIPAERSGGEFEAVAVSARRFCVGFEAMGGGGRFLWGAVWDFGNYLFVLVRKSW